MAGRMARFDYKDYLYTDRGVWQRSDLSAEAKGTLIYLLSLPPDWNIRVKNVARDMGYGRQKQQRIFRELQERRYLVKVAAKGKDGNFKGWDYWFSDLPIPKDRPLVGVPRRRGESHGVTENPSFPE